MKAPQFSLSDQNGTIHSLDDYKGRWLVVYFYPKDDTPGCTKEACSFRDWYDILLKKGISVVGISKDTVRSHVKFAKKFQLQFPLLSDPDLSVIKEFGSWGEKKFMGKTFDGILRKTYIIDPTGNIVKRYDTVNTEKHAEEVFTDIQSLQKNG